MPFSHDNKTVIAVTTRALFNLDQEHEVFLEDVEKFRELQLERYETPPQPGPAFSLVKKLLDFNTEKERSVEVVIVSMNDPRSGLRAFNACQHYNLDISRGVFTSGRPPFGYLKPFRSTLFLSAKEEDVRGAIEAGHVAAMVYPKLADSITEHEDELRIALDGDCVLFGSEAEEVYQREGLESFHKHEDAKKFEPLPKGPFHSLVERLHLLQRLQAHNKLNRRIRIALVTARNAPSHERAIRTLMHWNLEVDEAVFLGGLPKHEFLAEFRPDLFFDDQRLHCDGAATVVSTALVPFGPTHSTASMNGSKTPISQEESHA